MDRLVGVSSRRSKLEFKAWMARLDKKIEVMPGGGLG